MSNKASFIITLVIFILALRWVGKGKIQRAWEALFNKNVSSSTTSSSGTIPSGVPPPSLFGETGPFTGFGEAFSSEVARLDQAGLTAFGGGSLAHDYDYGSPPGSKISLPLGGTYTYLGNQTGKWGNLLGFKAPNGGFIELAHVENLQNLPPVRGTIQGGTVIGTVGKGPYDSSVWSGPHMAVITDILGADWLQNIQNMIVGNKT